MKLTDKIKITNEDNMELMARYPDDYFELAIVDPPYGIKEHGQRPNRTDRWASAPDGVKYKRVKWDNEPPTQEYFDELKRISKNQIVWGGNYFMYKIKEPSMGWVFWDKKNGSTDFSDGELAYTSFNKGLRKFEWLWSGFQKQKPEKRIHPTQKPVALYKWLLHNYANEGDKILDTHLGSGSIAIACHDYKYELTACELDKDYYNDAIKRIKNHVAQQKLF